MADKVVYIIENDPKLLHQMREALSRIDANLKIISSNQLEGFYLYIKNNFFSPPKDATPCTDQLVLILSQIDFLGPRYFTLIEKAKKMFRRKGISPKDQNTEIILTTFESPSIKQSEIESRVINNLIYKPFDQSILEQHLRFALSAHKPVRETTVFKQELSGLKLEVEMLKDVPLMSINELGFITHSDRPIPLNSLSKYYGSLFKSGVSTSAFAKCTECHQMGSHYISQFSYFGLINSQTESIRRFIAKNKKTIKSIPLNQNTGKPQITSLLFLKTDQDNWNEIMSLINEKFKGTDVHVFSFSLDAINGPKGFSELLDQKLSSLYTIQFDGVFISSNLIYNDLLLCQNWFNKIQDHNKAVVEKTIKNFKTFIITKDSINDQIKRKLSTLLTDIIFIPLDRSFFTKRLRIYFKNLIEATDPISIQEITHPEVIQAANPIQILQISEAGLVMRYQRELEIGTFRRFSLPRQNETENINLLGACHSHLSLKPTIDTQFVFFGITDKTLKQIRKWILDNHIQGKKNQ